MITLPLVEGGDNTASGYLSTVGGGGAPVIMSGFDVGNTAIGDYSTVSGGYDNTASGNYSTVSGGSSNTASGSYSWAGGKFANTGANNGTFAWADSTTGSSTTIPNAANQFAIKAAGGLRLLDGNQGAGKVLTDVAGDGVGTWQAIPPPPSTLEGLTDTNITTGSGYYATGSWVPDVTGIQFTQSGTYAGSPYYTALNAFPNNSNATLSNYAGNWMLADGLGTFSNYYATGPSVINDDPSGSYSNVTGFTTTGDISVGGGNVVDGYVLTWNSTGSTWEPAAGGGGGSGGTVQNANLSIEPTNEGTTAGNARGANSVDLQTKRSVNTQVASGDHSTISGGRDNTASGFYSTVGGGYKNNAIGQRNTISGGYKNIANGFYSTVGGGFENNAIGSHCTVGGGYRNAANGNYSWAGGRFASTGANNGTFAWADSTTASLTTIPNAANQFAIKAAGGLRLIDGNEGAGKVLTDVTGDGVGTWQAAAGGSGGTFQGTDATYDIRAANEGATAGNARGEYSVDLQTNRSAATQVASGNYSTISGGKNNSASGNYSTISGGSNTAIGDFSTIGGGLGNTANGVRSTVGGGYSNTATGDYSTVSGGTDNDAIGNYSWAGGKFASTGPNNGTFAWADSTTNSLTTIPNAANQFAIKAGGGLRLLDGNEGTAGYVLTADAAGVGTWQQRLEIIGFACSDETTPIAATGTVITTDWPMDFVITRVYASLGVAGTGSATTVGLTDVDAATQILNADLSLGITASNDETSTFAAAATSYGLTKGDQVTIEVNAFDSNVAAAGLKVYIEGYRS